MPATIPTDRLGEAMRATYPELAAVAAAAPNPVYLVGGAVRDLLLGRGRVDIDLVVEGDPESLAAALGVAPFANHDRFGTLKVQLDGHEIDIAAARSETYPRPGALPEVSRGAALEDDLARRDFTLNALALPLVGDLRLIDPLGGLADLEAGWLRVLHPASFVDDPTRAIRAARYAARLGLEPEPETERLLEATTPVTVSAERWRGELARLAREPTARQGLERLAGWGLLDLGSHWDALAAGLPDLLAESPWAGEVDPAEAWLAAALEPSEGPLELARVRPARPSEAWAMARGHGAGELLLARALGAEWLDEYMGAWREIELEIGGSDLIAAGVPEGEAVGRGLAAALRAKLDGEAWGREQELAVALAAASA